MMTVDNGIDIRKISFVFVIPENTSSSILLFIYHMIEIEIVITALDDRVINLGPFDFNPGLYIRIDIAEGRKIDGWPVIDYRSEFFFGCLLLLFCIRILTSMITCLLFYSGCLFNAFVFDKLFHIFVCTIPLEISIDVGSSTSDSNDNHYNGNSHNNVAE